MLTLGKEPALDADAFLALCRAHLTQDDQLAMEALLQRGGEGSNHPFIVAWRDDETRLRNAVARVRAGRRGVEAESYLRPVNGVDLALSHAVDDAFGRGTPAERELEIDRIRWHRIEALAGLDVFSPASVLAYGLKLKLASRWAQLSTEAGRQRLEDWVTTAAVESP